MSKNYLFICRPDKTWVAAHDLDDPTRSWWRVGEGGVAGRDPAVPQYMTPNEPERTHKGMWQYLAAETWLQISQHEAFALFPQLEQVLYGDRPQTGAYW